MFDPPAIAFARSGDAHLAYQVTGQGPPDLVYVAGSFATTVQWQEHAYARGFRRLASFSRLITFDQRGMGYSDPIDPAAGPSVAQLVTDLEAVIRDAGATEPVLFGTHNGGAVAAAYAARHPVRRLILCNTWARLKVADDYPIGFDDAVLAHIEARYRDNWGEGRIANYWAHARPEIETRRMELTSTSRNQALTLFYMNRDYDIRALLPAIRAPTLVVHLEDNMMIPPDFGRYIAEHIPGARLELLPGGDHMFMRNHADEVIDVVESFVTGTRGVFMDRLTTTMLFTDIVDSTPTAAAMGDERWSALIDEHNDRVRRAVQAEGGQEIKCTGDGFLVAFDDSAAAVRCAQAAQACVAELGLELRAGVHVGDVSPMGSHDVAGLAVHFAQRLCGRAGGGQVLVSAAVRDACVGDGLQFVPQGTVQLKGIPGDWEVFEVRP